MTSLDTIRPGLVGWLDRARAGDVEHVFSDSGRATPTLYPTLYAILARELVEAWDGIDREQAAAAVQQFQDAQTGFFWDDRMTYRPGSVHDEEYTRWHITCCALQALDALGARPTYPLAFLDPFREPGAVEQWLGRLNMKAAWRESNKIMALLASLYYAHDVTQDGVWLAGYHAVLDWLISSQDAETGLWGTDAGASRLNGMAATYHFLMFFDAVGRPVPHSERMLDTTLSLQLREGHYGPLGASACVDLDAVDILANRSLVTEHRAANVRASLLRAYEAIAEMQNPDAGFPEHSVRHRDVVDWVGFPTSYFRHGCKKTLVWQSKQVAKHLLRGVRTNYSGGIEQSPAGLYESTVWSAWFRPLAMAVVQARYPEAVPAPSTFTPRFRRLPGLGYTHVAEVHASS